jgi:hypothetical protein
MAKLRKTADAMGYSMSAFIYLAVERLLNHEPVLATYKEAIAQAEEARLVTDLEQVPELKTLLTADLELVKARGKKLVSADRLRPDISPHALEQLAETVFADGPATQVHLPYVPAEQVEHIRNANSEPSDGIDFGDEDWMGLERI